MADTSEQPELHFFRNLPDGLMSRPPLCSSLQKLETSFFSLAMGRFPDALVTTASSVESAMKAALNVPPEDRITATALYIMALTQYPALSSFDAGDLKTFRETRNRIAHYGFSPSDDEVTAALLLKTGLPFLSACYKEFFDFDLFDGLVVEFGEQLRIPLDVYQLAKDIPGLPFTYCFSAFSHLIRWSVRQSLMTEWEYEVSVRAAEIGANFDSCEKRKRDLELAFGAAWFFDCPICDEIDALAVELDEHRLKEGDVVLQRAACASCGLVVGKDSAFLADALCREQIPTKRDEILRDFGLAHD
jgi:hypothetical protein